MKLKVVVLLILGVWLGMVLGISFIEAPLKFQAPNITLSLGLGIGRLVFGALNKLEIAFSLSILIWFLAEFKKLNRLLSLTFLILIVIVALQTIWLLPVLDLRAETIISGLEPAVSNDHFYYVFLEVSKVVLLCYAFIKTYKHA